MTITTCSQLPRVFKCPASAVLPRLKNWGDNAGEGNTIHRILEVRAKQGWDASIDAIDPIAKEFSLTPVETACVAKVVRSFKWVPPAGAGIEVSRMMKLDGTSALVPEGKAAPGNYQVPDEYVLAGTSDAEWIEKNDVLWIVDYKTGDEANVCPVDTNAQLLSLAVMAANSLPNVKFVVPAILYVDGTTEQGIWEVPEGAPLRVGQGKMFAFEVKLANLLRMLSEQTPEKILADSTHKLIAHGHHCRYCPCLHACPKFTQMVRTFLGEPVNPALLSDGEIKRVLETFLAIQAAMASLNDMLRGYTDAMGSIRIGDDEEQLAWGPVPKSADEIQATVETFNVLAGVLGDAEAFRCATFSKSKIYEAARRVAQDKGLKISQVNREILDSLENGGLIQQVPRTWYEKHRIDVQR
jgi:PD-(D/E)XK nuclease superfamily